MSDSNPNIISIAPIHKDQEITKIQIEVPQYILHQTEMTVYVLFQDQAGRVVDTKSLLVPETVYSKWGTDDSYITNYVLQQISATRAAAPQPSPPS